MPADRDRDAAGRPRSARARDDLGRPLARGSAGRPAAADDTALAPADALDAAQRLLDAGQPFQAHEVLEASWKAAPAAERDLWQGLAQLAVGLTHAQRGNAAGAAALLRRGADRLARAASTRDVDIAGLVAASAELAAWIAPAGSAGATGATGAAAGPVTAGQLRLQLRSGPPRPSRPR